jgi:glycosyltransferase involved in cell wall biosynthesis
MDESNLNAQNTNAKALLSRFHNPGVCWTAICTGEPAESIERNGVAVVRLSPRLWPYQLALAYQERFDAIFYPGPHWPDEAGLQLRAVRGRRRPVIATFEGIIADAATVQRIAKFAGHAIHAQPGIDSAIPRVRRLYERADHIIAISPFLARVASFLYGQKVSCLPLGIDGAIFDGTGKIEPARCRVAGCGTVKKSKNPHLFLQLAKRFPETDFVWFGDGEMRAQLIDEAKRLALGNLTFPGSIPPRSLAEEFRKSSIFVLPSHAEGVPKVTQEAAACGLPVVLNGYYESPSVVHQHNGLVAWSDEELASHLGDLIADPLARTRMGQAGAEMVRKWDWNLIAPLWEELLLRLVAADGKAK